MKLSWAAAALVAAAMLAAPTATLASTNLNSSKSNIYRVGFVEAVNECAKPNAEHRGVLAYPACTPPVRTTLAEPLNVMSFGSGGEAGLELTVKGGDIAIKASAKSVLDNGTSFNGNLTAIIPVRWTDNGGSNGCGEEEKRLECTAVDFSLPVSIPVAKGKGKLKTSLNTLLPGAVQSGNFENIQVGATTVAGPGGAEWLQQGLFVP
jgi:hypothetical protein